MSILSDHEIYERCMTKLSPRMIEPFAHSQVKFLETKPVISFGLSSYGYDCRLANDFKVFTNAYGSLIDPKEFSQKCLIDVKSDTHIIVPANGFVLGRSLELFRIPRDIQTICIGKSTYARCGIIVNVTPLEPEWEGHVTIELSNTTTCPVKVYAGEGIMQVLFFKADRMCDTSYADRKGKYQGHKQITTAKV